MLSGPQHIESLTKPSNYIPVNPPDSQSSKEGNLVSRAFPLENGNEVVRDESLKCSKFYITHFFLWVRDGVPPKSLPPNNRHTTDISFKV